MRVFSHCLDPVSSLQTAAAAAAIAIAIATRSSSLSTYTHIIDFSASYALISVY